MLDDDESPETDPVVEGDADGAGVMIEDAPVADDNEPPEADSVNIFVRDGNGTEDRLVISPAMPLKTLSTCLAIAIFRLAALAKRTLGGEW